MKTIELNEQEIQLIAFFLADTANQLPNSSKKIYSETTRVVAINNDVVCVLYLVELLKVVYCHP